MNLRQQVEARIGTQVSGFKEVAGAAAINFDENLKKIRVLTPGCYVMSQSVSAKNTTANDDPSVQKHIRLISTVIAVSNKRDLKNADSSDQAEAYSDLIKAALINWQPNGFMPLAFLSGAQLSMKDGFYIWGDIYMTSLLYEAQQ